MGQLAVPVSNALDADQAFVTRDVSKPGRADDVTDRVHALDARAICLVDLDRASLVNDPNFLEAHPLHVADHPDSR
jgi:hypothetical protein